MSAATLRNYSCQYQYGPFGEVIRQTGPMAKANPFRFSTKYQDDETDLLYYGVRYEKDGRWLSRDPIGEWGGANLYGFVREDPINYVDLLGFQDKGQIPNPVIPPNWPTPDPGQPPLPPPNTPPGAPPGTPTSGSPTQPPPGTPPGAPPRNPPGSGPPSNPASAAGACVAIAADVFNAAVNRAIYNNAIRECQSKMGTGGGPKCCVISWCVYCRCGNGLKDINRVGLYVATKSCADVQADEKKYGTIHVSCPKNGTYVPTYCP